MFNLYICTHVFYRFNQISIELYIFINYNIMIIFGRQVQLSNLFEDEECDDHLPAPPVKRANIHQGMFLQIQKLHCDRQSIFYENCLTF